LSLRLFSHSVESRRLSVALKVSVSHTRVRFELPCLVTVCVPVLTDCLVDLLRVDRASWSLG